MFALLRDQTERHVLRQQQIAAVLMAAGAKDVQMPSVFDAWDDLDASLAEEAHDSDTDELRKVLGL